MTFIEACNGARIGGFAKAARHIHRPVLQKRMRGFKVRWPPGGLMLDYPKQQPNQKEPRNLRDSGHVDVDPGCWSSMTISSPDGSSTTTYHDQNGDEVDKPRLAPHRPESTD